METGISKIAGKRVVGKECFSVHFLKNNSECHQRFSQRGQRETTERSIALRSGSILTSLVRALIFLICRIWGVSKEAVPWREGLASTYKVQ